ncbi:MAG: glycosyltransferase [Peptococcia bacterium]
MKVAILTMFNGLDRTYSLVNVVAEHLTMLLTAGVPTKLLVSQDCPLEARWGIYADERLEWIPITNRYQGKVIRWHDYSQPTGKVHESFQEEAETVAEDLIKHLADVDVCMMHDIHYQGWHLLHNVAIRIAQKSLPHLRFIAFTHSAPVNRPLKVTPPLSARYTPMPRTTYVYPTWAGIPALAKQYNVPEGRCRVVNNSLDLLCDFSPETKKIASEVDILSPDILIIYPGRLTPGKQMEKVASLAGAIRKKTELSATVIFCDFPSLDIDSKKYKQLIKRSGYQAGLEESQIYFTTDLGFPKGLPHPAVMELFTLSNLFICPSYSESFGLTVLEAASRGNFLVLNQAVPALDELGRNLKAYFMRWNARNFGFDTKENYYPSEQAYLEENADRIITQMRENPVLHSKTLVRKRYSPHWIWENQLKPLIFNE